MDGVYQNRAYGQRLDLDTVRGYWKKTLRLIRRGKAPADVGLYIHWPFCAFQCEYCYCDSRLARGAADTAPYLSALIKELRAFRDVFGGVRLSSLILAGGTPTQASESQLEKLFECAHACFEFADGADISVEAAPATLTERKAAFLARAGVRRVDMGIDSLDQAVLRTAGRRQNRDDVRRAARALDRSGIALEAGLLYGLERQGSRSFIRDLVWVLGLKPAQVRLYAFDPRPQTRFARGGKKVAPEHRAKTRAVFAIADKLMRRAGYETSRRMWKVPSSYLGVGRSAKSRCFAAGWYQHPLQGRAEKATSHVPPFVGMPMSLSEEMRGCLIGSLATLGRMPRDKFRDLFGLDVMETGALADDVAALEADGAVAVAAHEVALTEGGRALRAQAMRRLYGGGVRQELERVYGRRWASGENGGVPPRAASSELECRVYEKLEGESR